MEESQEEREEGTGAHARSSGIRGGTRSRGRGSAQASADDIHGARSEAGNSDRVLWSVQGEGGVLSGRNPQQYSARKVTMAFNALGVRKNEGVGAAMLDEGLEVRDVTSHRPDAESERSRDGGGRRTEDRSGSSGRETAARLAECLAEVIDTLRVMARPPVCTAEVMERLRTVARTSVVAARMLANEERNRQLSRWRCRAVAAAGTAFPKRVRLLAARHSFAATDCRALAGARSSAGVRNGVRRIFRVPQRASPIPPC